jgi:tRNA uridine 5-carboxymethylaminomethyl modification enzyme
MSIPKAGPGSEIAAVGEQLTIEARYAGYLKRQTDQVARSARSARNDALALPADLDYRTVSGLSAEVCEKLNTHRPSTLGQASRIPGMTPAAVSLLLVHLRRDPPRKRA